jgi:large-conductance mechanosensitive channel
MISRIKAIKSTFSLMLNVSELVIAVIFILRMFSSEGDFTSIFADLGNFIEWLGDDSSAFADNSGIAGPAAFLVTVLGFMIFAFILITIVPKAIEKREKEIKPGDWDIE